MVATFYALGPILPAWVAALATRATYRRTSILERDIGLEPTLLVWKTSVLPLTLVPLKIGAVYRN